MTPSLTLVLLVDDDPDQLYLRGRLFELQGYRVATARSAQEALAAFTAQPAALVLMDLRLPGFDDGRSLIRSLKALSPHVRIVVLSGCADELAEAPEARLVEECLRKPVRSEILFRTIKRVANGA